MTDVVEPIDARMSALTAPIPGAKPSGDDLSFDPEFEQVKAEMEKIGSVSGVAPAWDKVVTISAKLLTSRTKDMRLATWLAVARMNKTGWAGLAEGLVVIRAITAKHWDTMYPERRPRARANLWGWLTEQVALLMENREATASDGDPLKACELLFREIDGVLAEKLGEMHPGMGTMRSLITSRLAQVPAPEPEQPQATEADAADNTTAAQAQGPATSPTPMAHAVQQPQGQARATAAAAAPVATLAAPRPGLGSNADGIADALKVCRETIVKAAELLREAQPSDPWAYHLQRVGAWLGIRQPPPAEGGKTFVPPPPIALRRDIEDHAAKGRWAPLLRECEPLTGTYLFWLDLHRYVADALKGLGNEHADAGLVVTRATVGFVQRLPAVLSLTFADRTPFANPQTATWLEENMTGGGGGAGGALAEEKAETDAKLESARKAITSGQIGEGVGVMVALARRAGDGRSSFRIELEAAQLALDAQKPNLARPILEGLVRTIDVRGLDSWDPEICVSVYASLLTALRATKPPIVDAGHREAVIIEKICRLDPALAVRMGI